MRLEMQNKTGVCQVLDTDDNNVNTGSMIDCVSVIVFNDLQSDGSYAQVRAYRGAGGLDNVNWKSLFSDITNRSLKLIVVSGPHHSSDYAQHEIHNKISRKMEKHFSIDNFHNVDYFVNSQMIFDRKATVQIDNK